MVMAPNSAIYSAKNSPLKQPPKSINANLNKYFFITFEIKYTNIAYI